MAIHALEALVRVSSDAARPDSSRVTVSSIPPKAIEVLCMGPPATPETPARCSFTALSAGTGTGTGTGRNVTSKAPSHEVSVPSPLALREWGFELVACACSWLFLAAIVVVLSTVDDKTLGSLPTALNLNTALAFLAASATTMAVVPVGQAVAQWKWIWFQECRPLLDFARLDAASRGVWGALVLAWTVRWRHPVSLGATLVVLAFVSVPLSQELVGYEASNGAGARVQVRWGWLAVLVGQTAASTAFVLYTVASTYTSRAAVLKSSVLPPLAAFAPEGSRLVRRLDGAHEPPSLEDLEARARQLRVCMMNGRMVILRDAVDEV